jgi:predicted thioesterase
MMPASLNPDNPVRIGLEGRVERSVPREWTIAAYDPRLPEVLSTPAMIGMMEVAAAQAIQPSLPPNTISVGTRIEVDHLKAVPTGTPVVATARLAKLDGRFLVFDVEAKSGDLVIGRGRVFRTIVEIAHFSTEAAARKDT